MKISNLTLSISLFLMVFCSTTVYAENEDSTIVNLFDMSIEDLIEQEVAIATKSNLKQNQTPSVVSIITKDEIKAFGLRDIEELLMIIPGMTTTQIRFGGRPYAIRGISETKQGGRFLILIDGVPCNGIMYGTGIYLGDNYNMDAIERIEIIRGPGSALYGRNAYLGVLNIVTKVAGEENAVDLGISYGSYDTKEIHSSLGYKKGNFKSYIAAKAFSTDGTDLKYSDGLGIGSESTWNTSHDNIYLDANAQYKNFSFTANYSRRDDGTSSGYYLTNGNTIFNVGMYSINYEKDFNDKNKIRVKAFGRNEHRIQNIEFLKPGTILLHPLLDTLIPATIYPEGIYAQPVFNSYNYGVEANYNVKLFKNDQLLIGTQTNFYGIKNAEVKSNYNLSNYAPLIYSEDEVIHYYSKDNMPLYEPGWIIDGGHSYYNIALYMQNVYTFNKNISVTLGGRLDIDSEVGPIFNPRLAIVYEPYDFTTIKLLYGEAYRAPTPNQQYKIMGFEAGNKDLKYEEIRTSELVIATKFNSFYTQVSLFYNTLENMILFQNINDTMPVKSYFNNGQNTSYGFEIESKFSLNSFLYAFANYSYVRSLDTRQGDWFAINGEIEHPNIAPHLVNVGINYRLNNKLNFAVLGKYVSEISKFYYKISPTSEISYLSQDKVGNYFSLNSSITINDLLKRLEISFYGYNLLNQKYYFQDESNFSQPAQRGIHFLLRASYKFNL